MLVRPLMTMAGLVLVWQSLVWATGVPPYILPAPLDVARVLVAKPGLLAWNGAVTGIEIIGGLVLGALLGATSALCLALFRPARRWLLPLLVVSQAIPVFALAPILVLWIGYGMASKIAMAVLIIYFPVTAAFFDGLRRTDHGWLDLARSMDATPGAMLRHIRIPAALPALASGLRVATSVAPIGAIVGEWVGSSSGLGFLMLHANARMQIDVMFAALLVLAVMAVGLYAIVDALARRIAFWQPETLSLTDKE